MDNYFEEMGKLSDKEINKKSKKNYNGSGTKVMRLNDKERRLIEYLRMVGTDRLLSEISTARSEDKSGYTVSLNDVSKILTDKEEVSLEKLIKDEVISNEAVNKLLDYVKNGQNIVITGSVGAGKTTLLNALLNRQENKDISICESYKEYDLNEDCENKNDVKYYNGETITNKDIASIGKSKNNIFALTEIVSSSDCLNLFIALNTGCNIITTMQRRYDDFKLSIVDLFSDDFKQYAKETLDKNKFVIVNVEIKDRKRKIEIIKDIF